MGLCCRICTFCKTLVHAKKSVYEHCCSKIFVTRLTRRVPLGHTEYLSSPPVFSGVRVSRSLVLCVCFVDRCLSFFFWLLFCLFFDIRILIIPSVSSSSSNKDIPETRRGIFEWTETCAVIFFIPVLSLKILLLNWGL